MFKKILARFGQKKVQKLYKENEYLEAYSKHTDIRVEKDYKAAIEFLDRSS